MTKIGKFVKNALPIVRTFAKHGFAGAHFNGRNQTTKELTLGFESRNNHIFAAALKLVVWLLFASQGISSGLATEYTLKGKYEYVIFDSGASPLHVDRFQFSVEVLDRSWFIVVRPASPTSLIERIEIGCDGTNTYVVTTPFRDRLPSGPLQRGKSHDSTNNASQKKASVKTIPARNEATAVVTSTAVPVNSPALADVLWLSFASHQLFSNLQGAELPLLTMLNMVPEPVSETNTINSEWRLKSDRDFLPEIITFYGRLLQPSTGPERKAQMPNQLVASHSGKAFRLGSYEAMQWTNINGSNIPLLTRLSRFEPESGTPAGTNTFLISRFEARIDSASPRTGRREFLPIFDRSTRVTDNRVKAGLESHKVSYFASQGQQWLEPDGVRKRREFAVLQETLRRRELGVRRQSWAVGALLLGTLVTTFGIFWCFMSLQKKSNG